MEAASDVLRDGIKGGGKERLVKHRIRWRSRDVARRVVGNYVLHGNLRPVHVLVIQLVLCERGALAQHLRSDLGRA